MISAICGCSDAVMFFSIENLLLFLYNECRRNVRGAIVSTTCDQTRKGDSNAVTVLVANHCRCGSFGNEGGRRKAPLVVRKRCDSYP